MTRVYTTLNTNIMPKFVPIRTVDLKKLQTRTFASIHPNIFHNSLYHVMDIKYAIQLTTTIKPLTSNLLESFSTKEIQYLSHIIGNDRNIFGPDEKLSILPSKYASPTKIVLRPKYKYERFNSDVLVSNQPLIIKNKESFYSSPYRYNLFYHTSLAELESIFLAYYNSHSYCIKKKSNIQKKKISLGDRNSLLNESNNFFCYTLLDFYYTIYSSFNKNSNNLNKSFIEAGGINKIVTSLGANLSMIENVLEEKNNITLLERFKDSTSKPWTLEYSTDKSSINNKTFNNIGDFQIPNILQQIEQLRVIKNVKEDLKPTPFYVKENRISTALLGENYSYNEDHRNLSNYIVTALMNSN